METCVNRSTRWQVSDLRQQLARLGVEVDRASNRNVGRRREALAGDDLAVAERLAQLRRHVKLSRAFQPKLRLSRRDRKEIVRRSVGDR